MPSVYMHFSWCVKGPLVAHPEEWRDSCLLTWLVVAFGVMKAYIITSLFNKYDLLVDLVCGKEKSSLYCFTRGRFDWLGGNQSQACTHVGVFRF